MDPLRRILRNDDESPNLDEAALCIARIEFPGLELAPWLAEMDLHAVELDRRRKALGGSFRLAAQKYLFEGLGLSGNEEDYYNPRNSCLNHVLQSRMGIPLTLSVLYMELGRRLGQSVDGIGAPGHFLVRLEEDGETFYLDPYHRGKIREDVESEVDSGYLSAAPKRTVLIRMLNNLRLIYLQRQSWTKAVHVLDLLLEADAEDTAALRQRAASYAATQRYQAAVKDLEAYLSLRPLDPDKEDLMNQMGRLRRMQSQKN